MARTSRDRRHTAQMSTTGSNCPCPRTRSDRRPATLGLEVAQQGLERISIELGHGCSLVGTEGNAQERTHQLDRFDSAASETLAETASVTLGMTLGVALTLTLGVDFGDHRVALGLEGAGYRVVGPSIIGAGNGGAMGNWERIWV